MIVIIKLKFIYFSNIYLYICDSLEFGDCTVPRKNSVKVDFQPSPQTYAHKKPINDKIMKNSMYHNFQFDSLIEWIYENIDLMVKQPDVEFHSRWNTIRRKIKQKRLQSGKSQSSRTFRGIRGNNIFDGTNGEFIFRNRNEAS